MSKPVLRGKTWYLKPRVTARFATVEERAVIWGSLSTDSYSVAVQKSAGVWLNYVEGWEALLAGKGSDAFQKFRVAQQLASVRGFQFLAIDKVEQAPLEEILQRVEASQRSDGEPDEDILTKI